MVEMLVIISRNPSASGITNVLREVYVRNNDGSWLLWKRSSHINIHTTPTCEDE